MMLSQKGEFDLENLERIFREHQRNGEVANEYETRVYYGRLINTAAA